MRNSEPRFRGGAFKTGRCFVEQHSNQRCLPRHNDLRHSRCTSNRRSRGASRRRGVRVTHGVRRCPSPERYRPSDTDRAIFVHSPADGTAWRASAPSGSQREARHRDYLADVKLRQRVIGAPGFKASRMESKRKAPYDNTAKAVGRVHRVSASRTRQAIAGRCLRDHCDGMPMLRHRWRSYRRGDERTIYLSA